MQIQIRPVSPRVSTAFPRGQRRGERPQSGRHRRGRVGPGRREDDLDRGIRDYANRGEGWRGSRRGAGCGVWLPVREFPPPGVEGGFGQAAGGTERSDSLTRSLPGADGIPPELLSANVATTGLGHDWGLLI